MTPLTNVYVYRDDMTLTNVYVYRYDMTPYACLCVSLYHCKHDVCRTFSQTHFTFEQCTTVTHHVSNTVMHTIPPQTRCVPHMSHTHCAFEHCTHTLYIRTVCLMSDTHCTLFECTTIRCVSHMLHTLCIRTLYHCKHDMCHTYHTHCAFEQCHTCHAHYAFEDNSHLWSQWTSLDVQTVPLRHESIKASLKGQGHHYDMTSIDDTRTFI